MYALAIVLFSLCFWVMGMVTVITSDNGLYGERDRLIEECQAELPRNQYCEIEMIAKPKSKGASE